MYEYEYYTDKLIIDTLNFFDTVNEVDHENFIETKAIEYTEAMCKTPGDCFDLLTDMDGNWEVNNSYYDMEGDKTISSYLMHHNARQAAYNHLWQTTMYIVNAYFKRPKERIDRVKLRCNESIEEWENS